MDEKTMNRVARWTQKLLVDKGIFEIKVEKNCISLYAGNWYIGLWNKNEDATMIMNAAFRTYDLMKKHYIK